MQHLISNLEKPLLGTSLLCCLFGALLTIFDLRGLAFLIIGGIGSIVLFDLTLFRICANILN